MQVVGSFSELDIHSTIALETVPCFVIGSTLSDLENSRVSSPLGNGQSLHCGQTCWNRIPAVLLYFSFIVNITEFHGST